MFQIPYVLVIAETAVSEIRRGSNFVQLFFSIDSDSRLESINENIFTSGVIHKLQRTVVLAVITTAAATGTAQIGRYE